ncbi:MAG: sterol desaturase family protein [Pseudomonas taetrolens]|uniref:sterol desaturase family protein n=1 Tax=Pseudomonas taetrolens TaxID=47884 RepID=UPI003F99D734
MNDLIVWMEATFGAHIEWKQVVLIGMTPLFLVGFAIEWQIMRKRGARQQFYWKDILTNLTLGSSYQLFELAAHVIFVGAAVFWFWDQRFFTIPVNGWTLLPIFLGVEFCYYWFHRCSHRVRWFWTAHVVHHSGEHMNMTTAMRQSMLYSITGWWLFFMPLVLLGVHPAVVFILYACNLVYQFFIHTESVGKLHPVLEYLFDTPSNHRAHHGRNDCYIDRNYGCADHLRPSVRHLRGRTGNRGLRHQASGLQPQSADPQLPRIPCDVARRGAAGKRDATLETPVGTAGT